MSDLHTSVINVSIFIAGSDFPTAPKNDTMINLGGSVWQYTFVPNIPGTRTYTIYIKDLAGNYNTTTGTFTVTALPGTNPLLDLIMSAILIPVASAIVLSSIGLVYRYQIKPRLKKGKVKKVLQQKSKVDIGVLKDDLGLEPAQVMKITEKLRKTGDVTGCWNRDSTTFYNEREILTLLQFHTAKSNIDLATVKVDRSFLMSMNFPDEEQNYIAKLTRQAAKGDYLAPARPAEPKAAVPFAPEKVAPAPTVVRDAEFQNLLSQITMMDKPQLIAYLDQYRQYVVDLPTPNQPVLQAIDQWKVKIQYAIEPRLSESDAVKLAENVTNWNKLFQ